VSRIVAYTISLRVRDQFCGCVRTHIQLLLPPPCDSNEDGATYQWVSSKFTWFWNKFHTHPPPISMSTPLTPHRPSPRAVRVHATCLIDPGVEIKTVLASTCDYRALLDVTFGWDFGFEIHLDGPGFRIPLFLLPSVIDPPTSIRRLISSHFSASGYLNCSASREQTFRTADSPTTVRVKTKVKTVCCSSRASTHPKDGADLRRTLVARQRAGCNYIR
jgi:hypothetical protein